MPHLTERGDTMKRAIIVVLIALMAGVLPMPVCGAASNGGITLDVIDSYATNIFDDGGAETVAFDPGSEKIFVTNGADTTLDVLMLSDDGSTLNFVEAIGLSDYGSPTHVEAHEGLVAVTVLAEEETDPGQVVFLLAEGGILGAVPVGAFPDSLKFSPDGTKVVTADEGQPNDDYTVDPEGSITIMLVRMNGLH